MAVQSLFSWLKGSKGSRQVSPKYHLDRRSVLRLEPLEDRSVPATFTVNTALDTVVAGDGKQSLREAITRANDLAGADVIVVPAGVFTITNAGAGENGNATGDFDITDAVTIRGVGAGKTVIDGQQLDRVFDISGTAASSIKVVLQGLTARNGKVTNEGGGGIRVANADLVLRDCAVNGNRASLNGGGISNAAAPEAENVTLIRTTVARNIASESGGGIYVFGAIHSPPGTVHPPQRRLFFGGGGASAATPAFSARAAPRRR